MPLPSNMDGVLDNDTVLDETDAEAAFLKLWEDPAEDASKKKPSDQGNEEDEDESTNTDESDDEESDESPDDEAEDEDGDEDETAKDKKYADNDEAYVKIKVGEEEHEVPVKDLKRLFGQEAALTQKSQEVADRRKALDTEATTHAAASAALLERAMKQWEPYSKIDFVLAAKELPAEDYTALREQAQAAYENVQFLKNETGKFYTAMQERQRSELAEQAKEAIKVLSGDPKEGGIEGWSTKLYDELRAFAVTQGLDQEVVNNLVDPAAIRLLNKARLYDLSTKKAQVKTVKTNKSPKKIIKSSQSSESTKTATKGTDTKKSMDRLRETGSTDDAANAFLSRWKDSDD